MARFVATFSLLVLATFVKGDCDAGWYQIGTNCFIFDLQKISYQEARNYCAFLRSDADLAIVEDANVLRKMYEYIIEYQLTGNFWLGGSDAVFEGDWKWVDDSRVSIGTPFWALENGAFGWKQEPIGGTSQNCLVLDGDRLYYMDDRSCFESNRPICMY